MSRHTRLLESLFLLSSISAVLSSLGWIISTPLPLSIATVAHHVLILFAHIVHTDLPRPAVVVSHVRRILTNVWRNVVKNEPEADNKVGEKEGQEQEHGLVQPGPESKRPLHPHPSPAASSVNVVVVYVLAATWLVVNWREIRYTFRHALNALVVLSWISAEIVVLVAIGRVCAHLRDDVLQGRASASST